MAEQDKTVTEPGSNNGKAEEKLEYGLPVAGILLSVGLIILVAHLATSGVQHLLDRDQPDGLSWLNAPVVIGALMTIGGLALGGFRLPKFIEARSIPADDCDASVKGYTGALVGIGFALVLLSLLNFVALAGLAQTGELRAVLGVAEEQPDYDTVGVAIQEELTRLKEENAAAVAASGTGADEAVDELAQDNRTNRINELDHMSGRLTTLSDVRLKLTQERRKLQESPADGDTAAANLRISRLESELRIAQDAVDEFPKSHNSRVLGMIRLVLLPGFAVLGGLFFVAGSLRGKREACEAKQPKEKREKARKAAAVAAGAPEADSNADDTGEEEECKPYDRMRLWSGLWYRLGEAILFALVIFLVIHSTEEEVPGNIEALLLLVGLLMGMFVKPAELLVNGLALRVLEAVKSLVK